ncbi:hypothetical protein DUI87_13005 [Hirundo rustica rustica]|uniref:Uncharacterized protein n=1 Tax=Hirundo rustica rustica TaxID=333673 RepID=A0A3M0KG55_HIRRU|nr:hypothetical protein DUI87_13005 [Hirundo rustica rustica]
MLREAPAGTRKNIPAAKKMDYPAAGGNPTGEGWSRGIGLWVTLVILSQAMCPTNGLHEPQEGMGMETNLPTVPPNLTRNRVLESRVRVDWFTPKRGENRQWNGGVKLNKSNHPMATARKRREDEEGLDPENKIQKVALEFKRQELAAKKKRKREVKKGLPQVGGNQKWGEEEWPAERIIEYYGPATWAQDGSWGYRTPVYY